MTEHFTHLWMKLISLVSKCMHVLHTRNCEMKDSHALPPLYAKLILVSSLHALLYWSLLCISTSWEGNAEEFAHIIT